MKLLLLLVRAMKTHPPQAAGYLTVAFGFAVLRCSQWRVRPVRPKRECALPWGRACVPWTVSAASLTGQHPRSKLRGSPFRLKCPSGKPAADRPADGAGCSLRPQDARRSLIDGHFNARSNAWLVATFLLVLFGVPSASAQKPSEIIFQTHFAGPNALAGWQNADKARLIADSPGSQSVQIEQSAASGPGSSTISITLPVKKMRGARIDFCALIKADNVAVPPEVWNGIKFMLVIEGPLGKQYPASDHLWGTFDWAPEMFRVAIPSDATKATLVLGLEATTGRASFRDVRVTVHDRPFTGVPIAPANRIYNGHPDILRFRGAMVSPDVSAADLHVLGGQWHANLIRYQLYWVTQEGRFDGWRDPAAFDAWLEGRLRHLDEILPACRKEGIRVVVDLHSPPGGNIMLPGGAWPLFQKKTYQDKFAQVWDKIARRYKGDKTVWGL